MSPAPGSGEPAKPQTLAAPALRVSGAAALRALLDTVRALTGDDAYERYLARHRSVHSEVPALSPADFYASEIERRYSGVSRCC